MNARFSISNDRLRSSLVIRADRTRDLRQPLELAGALSRDAAVVRIRQEGSSVDPPWIPSRKTQSITIKGKYGIGDITIAGSGGRTGFDTGNMARSITWALTDDGVKIGTNVPYAKWFQFGSGEFAGHTSWTIRPRSGGALSWVFGGRRFFARQVVAHGQPPRPFLFFDEPLVEAIVSAFRKYVSAA